RTNLLVFPGELPANQRNRNDAGGVDLLEPALQGEGVAELMGSLSHQILELNLAGDVARAVARLAQVELLLEAEEVEVGAHPAARGPFDLEGLGLREVELVGLEVERGEPAGGALGEHDPDDLARPRLVVEEAGVEHELFHGRGHALGAGVPYVVKERTAPDGARMRLVAQARQVPPVRGMRVE